MLRCANRGKMRADAVEHEILDLGGRHARDVPFARSSVPIPFPCWSATRTALCQISNRSVARRHGRGAERLVDRRPYFAAAAKRAAVAACAVSASAASFFRALPLGWIMPAV